eukprot:GHVR01137968.1.p2 GENE.GHVR01137968.1~~GHVR01137968.1.p2  ORF type:complete len:351 (-),score=31.53 GHVR01137968.1:870-1922(-)
MAKGESTNQDICTEEDDWGLMYRDTHNKIQLGSIHKNQKIHPGMRTLFVTKLKMVNAEGDIDMEEIDKVGKRQRVATFYFKNNKIPPNVLKRFTEENEPEVNSCSDSVSEEPHVDEDPADVVLALSALGVTHKDFKPGEEALFEEAMSKELKSFVDNNVLIELEKGKGTPTNVIPAGWRLTWKLVGNVRKPKARLCVQGFKDKRTDLVTYSGTPSAEAQRVAHIIGHTLGFRMAYSDVCTAFLQAPLSGEQPVYVSLPELMPAKGECHGLEAGKLYRLRQSVYGLNDSPKAFKTKLTRTLVDLKYQVLSAEDSLYVRRNTKGGIVTLLLAYVDDLQCRRSSTGPEGSIEV